MEEGLYATTKIINIIRNRLTNPKEIVKGKMNSMGKIIVSNGKNEAGAPAEPIVSISTMKPKSTTSKSTHKRVTVRLSGEVRRA